MRAYIMSRKKRFWTRGDRFSLILIKTATPPLSLILCAHIFYNLFSRSVGFRLRVKLTSRKKRNQQQQVTLTQDDNKFLVFRRSICGKCESHWHILGIQTAYYGNFEKKCLRKAVLNLYCSTLGNTDTWRAINNFNVNIMCYSSFPTVEATF